MTIPLTYGYILNKVRRGLGVVLRAYGHGRRNVRVTIPAYRYCPGRMHRNLRATIPFTYRSLINGARRGVRATIPAYRRGVDSMHRSARATIPFTRLYVLDRVRRGARTVISRYRYAPDGMRPSILVTSLFTYRYAFDRVRRRIRLAISGYRHAVDGTHRSTRPIIARYRFGFGRTRRGLQRAIPGYHYAFDGVRRRIRPAISRYRYAADGMRGSARPIVARYRYGLGRTRPGFQPAILRYHYALDRTYRGIQPVIPRYRYAFDRVRRCIRLAISRYRYAVNGMRRSNRPIIARYRYALDRRCRGIQPAISRYRHAVDGLRRSARPAIPGYHHALDRTCRGIQPAIPRYRHAADGMRRSIRATLPLIYRDTLDAAHRGTQTTVPAYRYLLDRIRQGTQAAFSFPPFRYGIISVTALVVLCPLCLVLYQSFLTLPITDSNARPGLMAYQLIFADNDFRVAFGTTLLLAAAMTLIAVPLGAALAFLIMRTDVPGRRWLGPLILLPIFVPALVLAFGYVEALGPTGILTTTFNNWAAVVPWNVYSFPFLVTIAGLTHAPYAYLCVATALRGIGDDGEQAARSCGAGPWKVAFGVSLPMMMPAILLATALVFFLGFELFGLPLVLGDAQGLLVLSTYLFKLTNQLGTLPVQPVAVVIVIMVAVSLPLLLIQRAMPLPRFGRPSPGAPKPVHFAPFRLGLWRVPILLTIAFWLAAALLVPLGVLALRSFTTAWGEGIALWRALTFDHYRELLEYPSVIRSIVNTLGIALFGGAAAAAFYTGIVLAIHRWHSGWAQAIYYLVLLPRAMPGLAAGLALLWVLLLLKPLTSLHGTLVSVWLAYTLVWLSYGTQLISRALLKVDQQLEDIARTVGATEGRMKLDVTLPLIRDGLLAGWLLFFPLCAGLFDWHLPARVRK